MAEPKTLRIRPSRRLSGVVSLPGDKSLSHRALLFASLGTGVSRIRNCAKAGVSLAMIECLQALGVQVVEESGPTLQAGVADLRVTGKDLVGFEPPSAPLHCRGSATTMRLMAGMLAGQAFQSTLDGNERLRTRPMGRVVEPLRAKGARIATDTGNAPLSFFPSRLQPSEHLLPVASAQVKSALLLAGLFTDGPTTVIEPFRSRDHTERMLKSLGAPVTEYEDQEGRHHVTVSGAITSIPSLDVHLPSDPSSAAFLVTAGLLVPDSNLEVTNLCLNPGRTGLFDVLRSMGADLRVNGAAESDGEPTGTITVESGALRGATIQGALVIRMIDEFPILAVAATQASGTTVVRDAAELRVKESDRIETLAEELNKMGAEIQTAPDGFTIIGPRKLTGTVVNARGDHRLGMSLAVAGLIAEGETLIQGWEIINDSFPEFPRILKELGADIQW
ncbi:MAG: 3-phosphoshikimate 1-carboxyvinyltransferase [Desulfomonilaceae bacterium]